jgi:RNA polymerase sigma-54 factor
MTKQYLKITHQQSLIMTHSLQLAIKILQLSSHELNEYVAEEVEKNPLLTDSKTDLIEENPSQNEVTEEYEEDGVETLNDDQVKDSEIDWQTPERNSNNKSTNDHNLYEMMAVSPTLKEHAIEQIYLNIANPDKRKIALHITDLLDENGYISNELENLALTLGYSITIMEEVLALLQEISPAGVFARSLSECLSIQLREKQQLTPAFEILLDNLELLAKGEFVLLQKKCATTRENLIKMITELRTLNPKPGNTFQPELIGYIQPDVFLYQDNNNKWVVELNNDILPKVLIDRHYYALVKKQVTCKEGQKYLSEQLTTANSLVKALDQRAKTVLMVAREIAALQQDFFEKGIMFLKPLTLKAVSESLNMHESTISRVTSNKYISSPQGLFEMKYFFSSSLINRTADEECSSKTVKHLIKELINNEQPNRVLSDEKIVELLRIKGFEIARRTVAKYRESLNIPTSAKRKKEKITL